MRIFIITLTLALSITTVRLEAQNTEIISGSGTTVSSISQQASSLAGNLLGLNIQQPTYPQAYEDTGLPPQRNIALRAGNRTWTNPDDKLLQELYGDEYQNSTYVRTRDMLSNDTELLRHVQRLQATRGTDLNIYVNYDNPAQLVPGETFQHYDQATDQWRETTVKRGDSAADVASRLGTDVNSFIEEQERVKRFNVWPCASWNGRYVQLSEANGRDDGDLRGTIAHEVAHTVDGTANYPFQYGNDGVHTVDEVSDHRTAWIEGWAEYNGALMDPRDEQHLTAAIDSMYREMPWSSSESPEREPLLYPSYQTRLANEGTVGAILLGLDGNGAHRDDVFSSFTAENKNYAQGQLQNRRIDSFVQRYIADHPDQANRSVFTVDGLTDFRASPDDLRRLAAGASIDDYLSNRDRLRLLADEYRVSPEAGNQLDFIRAFDTRHFPHDIECTAGELGIGEERQNNFFEVDSNGFFQMSTDNQQLPPMELIGTGTGNSNDAPGGGT